MTNRKPFANFKGRHYKRTNVSYHFDDGYMKLNGSGREILSENSDVVENRGALVVRAAFIPAFLEGGRIKGGGKPRHNKRFSILVTVHRRIK
jgi:hypothetical protein